MPAIIFSGPDSISFLAEESITVSTVAKSLTAATYGSATYAVVTVAAQPIRFWVDATDPTATVGHVAADGDTIILSNNSQIEDFRAIRDGATDSVISISYGGRSAL